MRRKLLIGLALLAVALVVAVTIRPSADERLADLVAHVQARGEPITQQETVLPLPLPEQNGAQDLAAAEGWFAEHVPSANWDSEIPGPWNVTMEWPWDEHATPAQMEEARAFVASLAPLYAHLDRAADRDVLAWPVPDRTSASSLAKGYVGIPIVQRMQRLTEARTTLAPSPEERIRSIRTSLALGARFRALGVLQHSVASAMERIGCNALRTSLERGTIDPAAARGRLDELLAPEWASRFPEMVRTERAALLDELPFWIDGSLEAAAFGKAPDTWDRLIRGAKTLTKSGPQTWWLHPSEAIDWVRDLDRYLDADPGARTTWEETRHLPGRLDTVDLDAIAYAVSLIREKLVRTDALARLGRVALAAYEHRARHGDWPGSVDELAPLFADGLPVDPYTGKAFELSREGDDLVLRAQPWDGVVRDRAQSIEEGFVWVLPPR